jgi:hypothetical protein
MNKKLQHQLKTLYEHQQGIEKVLEILTSKYDCFDGISVDTLKIIENCTVRNDGLYQKNNKIANGGLIDDLYYCNQLPTCDEDIYQGYMYFPLDENGTYIRIYYEC